MTIVGVITVPLGDRVLTLPVVSFPYANLDAPRMPGGLFVDDEGHLGIAVDARASMPSIHASAVQSAIEAANALADLPN